MEQFIAIGRVIAPHGVRGDVRVLPLTDFPERFLHTPFAYLENGEKVKITQARRHKQYVLLHIAGYESPEAAEQLRGSLLRLPRELLVPLPPGHYYIFDIIGLSVYSEDGEFCGTVVDVLRTGSNDVYVVDRPGQRQLLVPALKQIVLSIDISGKRMTIKKLEEWLAHED